MRSRCPDDSVLIETVRFRSEGRLLNGQLAYADGIEPVAAALLAGPHPLLGGTMKNNVVRGLGDGLARRGIVTLRFDYRGVGISEGPAVHSVDRLMAFWQTSQTDDQVGYREDLIAAGAFLRQVTGTRLLLARLGYSFGCSLLAEIPSADATTPLVLIAPTVGIHDYESLTAETASKLVIAPEGDFAADAGRLREWFDRLKPPKELIATRMDGHFFRGHEEWLADTVHRFIAGVRENGS